MVGDLLNDEVGLPAAVDIRPVTIEQPVNVRVGDVPLVASLDGRTLRGQG